MGSSGENGIEMVEATNTSNSESDSQTRHPSTHAEEDWSDDDERMPLRGSRNGNWWYALYHNITAIVGSGVLGLPTAMAYLGWEGGILLLVISWIITLYTLWQLVEMYETKDENGKIETSKTYHELGQMAFGETRGLWIILPQLLVFVGVDIVYMVTGGLGQTPFIILFASAQFVFAQLDGLNSIAFFSLFASVTSFCYSTIIWVESWKEGISNHRTSSHAMNQACTITQTDYKFPSSDLSKDIVGVFSAVGVVAFAYGAHNVVLEIQNTLPSSKENPSKIRMWRGVLLAYVVVALCYLPVAISGYWAFGSKLPSLGNSAGPLYRNFSNQLRNGTFADPVDGSILNQLRRGRWIVAASLMVTIHVTGGYLVYAMPAFEIMEKMADKFHFTGLLEDIMDKFHFQQHRTQKKMKFIKRMVMRNTYVFFTGFLACTFPFFADLLAAFGGLAITPTTYFLPCIIWLQLRKPKPFTMQWLINWFCIIVAVVVTVLGTIGGVWSLTLDSKKYKFYQFTCEIELSCEKVYFE